LHATLKIFLSQFRAPPTPTPGDGTKKADAADLVAVTCDMMYAVFRYLATDINTAFAAAVATVTAE